MQKRYDEDSIDRGSYDEMQNQRLYDYSKTHSYSKDMTTKRTRGKSNGKSQNKQGKSKVVNDKNNMPMLQWGKIQQFGNKIMSVQ